MRSHQRWLILFSLGRKNTMIRFVLFLAEIADKEPTLLKFWSVAIVLSVASLLFGLWRRWTVLIPASLSIIWAYAVWSELQDRVVRPALQEQLGDAYVIQGYASTLLPLAVVVCVFFRATPKEPDEML